MTDLELEALIEAALDLERDYDEGVLRPPASIANIDECEILLGRRFPPSYRHFLSLHNGWEAFPGGKLLLGTEDYTSQAVRDEVAGHFQCHLEILEAPVESVPIHIFWPENIYHLYDLTRPDFAIWTDLAYFIRDYNEVENSLLWAKHLVVAVDFDAPSIISFDYNTLDAESEMEVVRLWNDGSVWRHKNFYELLEFLGGETD